MALPGGKEVCLEAEPPRPSALLRQAEDEAIAIAKLLQALKTKMTQGGNSASVEDALQIADTIAVLAKKGRQSNAEQSIDVLSRVEVFLDLLNREVNELLAKTK